MKKHLILLLASILIAHTVYAGVYEDILFAAEQGETHRVIDLLRRGMDVNTADPQGNTLLMIAVRGNNLELARFLLDNHANPNRRNRYGDTALMLATLGGHAALAKRLLDHGADPNTPGWTALHYAAFENRPQIASLLLAAGARINAVAPNGSTALMLAAKRGHLEMVRLLVGAGAELNEIDQDEGTALDMARKANHAQIVEFLQRAGAR